MTTITQDAAARLADPKCDECDGAGWTERTAGGLLVACKCVRGGERRAAKEERRRSKR